MDLGFELPDIDWDWVKGAGSLLGGVGSIYNAYSTNKNYEKMNDLYAQDRARNIARQEKAEDNISDGITAGFKLDEDKDS